MGDLTAQLAELTKLRKHDEAEYEHTRQVASGFRDKYHELADFRKENLALP
jgi:hypothetical protein